MTSAFQTLFSISIDHDYFADLSFKGFTIKPVGETISYLSRRGIFLKTNANTVNALIETSSDEFQKLNQLYSEKYVLTFSMTLNDPNFYTYTNNLSADLLTTVFSFNNSVERNSSILHAGEYVSALDTLPYQQLSNQFMVKPFAMISIQILQTMKTDLKIRFQSRSTYWKYIITSTYLLNLQKVAIISEEKDVFLGPESVQLRDMTPALVFRSEQPIKLSQLPAKTFMLVENFEAGSDNYRILKKILPVPDPARISCSFEMHVNDLYSEIFI